MSTAETVNTDGTGGAVTAQQRTLRIPKGFQALLEGFAREVLRSQPPDIYVFGAEYFDRMVHVRAGDSATMTSDISRARTTEAGAADSRLDLKPANSNGSQPSDKEANGIRQPLDKDYDQVDLKETNVAMDKQETPIASANAAEAAVDEQEPIDIDLTDPDVQAAAAKIQKGWGNRRAAAAKTAATAASAASKSETQQQPQAQAVASDEANKPADDEVVDIDLNDPQVQAASAKIQKGWGNRKMAANKQKASD